MTQTATTPGALSAAEAERDVEDLASGALVNLVGKLGRLSRGAFLWVVTLLCGLEVQGLFSLVWGLIATLQKVGRFGLHLAVVRFAAEARGDGKPASTEQVLAAALGLGTLASAAVTGLILLGADWLASCYGQPIAPALRIMILSTLFLTWTWIFVAATRSLRIMRYDVYVTSIAGPLILLAGGLVVGLGGWGLEGIAWVHLVMGAGCCWLAARYAGRFFSLAGCWRGLRRRPVWREMGSFSLPVMATDVLYTVLTQLDLLMLGWFVEVKLVGVYALTKNIAGAMLKAPQSFDPIFSSIASELSAREQHRELGSRFAVVSGWILTINLPILAGILLAGDALLPLLGDGQASHLQAGLEVLAILCAGMMVQGLCAMVDPVLTMSGRPYLNLFNNALWLAANFLLNLWLIREHGLVGAAWGAAIAALLAGGLRLTQLYLICDILPFRRSQLKPLGAALGGGLAGWLSRSLLPDGALWAAALSLAVFLGMYIFLLRLLGMGPEERVLVRRFKVQAKRIFHREQRP